MRPQALALHNLMIVIVHVAAVVIVVGLNVLLVVVALVLRRAEALEAFMVPSRHRRH